MINCILAGVGGQGTVLASKLIAHCALNKGMKVHSAETIGMAQKGGSVVSHVRIGEKIYSPLIPFKQADVLIGFEPSEALRNLHYLKNDGTVVVSSKGITPTTATLTNKVFDSEEMINYMKSKIKNVIVVDADHIIKECGTSKVLNLALLGAASSSGELGIDKEDIEKVIDTIIAPQYRKVNHKAVELGSDFVSIR